MWLLEKDSTPLAVSAFTDVDNIYRINDLSPDNGLQYLSWLSLNEYRKIPAFSTAMENKLIQLESEKLFKKEKIEFKKIIVEERDFMDEFTFLFSQTVNSVILELNNPDFWIDKSKSIKSLRKSKSGFQKLSGERLFDFCWRLCIEQYYWLMSSKQYSQAYKAAKLLSFQEVNYLKPEFLMSRAAAGFSDRALCLRHLLAAVNKEKISKEFIEKDVLLSIFLSDEEINKLY